MSVIGSNILAGASGAGGGYQISRSVRLRSSASAYFSRTLTTPSNPKKWTFSAWVKGSFYNGTNYTHLFGTGAGANDTSSNQFIWSGTNSNLAFTLWSINVLITNAVYRDPSAWYHVMLVMDNANATASNRAKIYVNGVEPTYSTDNRASLSTTTNYAINSAILHTIGRWAYNSFVQPEQLDAYITEVNFIDGEALTPISFGETNPITGVWQPKKYAGTYGTNGFYLNFSDNSAATAAAIGKDYSGNGNNWTPNNISVTAGVTYDSMLDVPTQWADGGNGRGNYCTGNPLIMYNGGGGAPIVPKNGNLDLIGGAGWAMVGSTIAVSTGKWYWEATFFKPGSGDGVLGIHKSNTSLFQIVGYSGDPNGYGYAANGNKQNNSTGVAYGASYTNGDVIGVALDLDAGTLTFYKNNTSQGTAFSSLSGEFFPAFSSETAYFQANFGQRPFAYTPPSGFKALNTLNLPEPTILKGNQYFDATLWNGQNTTLSVTNSGAMQPDFVWIKKRSAAADNNLVDSVRGTNKNLISNSTAAEDTTARLTSFNSNGFTLAGNFDNTNISGSTYVGWQWKAGGTPAVTNTAGTITSTVSAGVTQGFSAFTYSGTGVSGTVGHGLNAVPKMIIFRPVGVAAWLVYHVSTGNTGVTQLQSTGAFGAFPNMFNNTSPTNTVITLGTDPTINGSGGSGGIRIAYCFADVAGFSKFGSYTGNGSADGTFVYLGFRPRFIMFKRTDATSNWLIIDTARSQYNQTNEVLLPNSSSAEGTGAGYGAYDFLSNGFKPRNVVANETNVNGGTYIYAAFAENPFKNALAR